jgi:hypothetical protein
MMKWLKRYLLLIVILLVSVTNGRAAESVQVSVPQTFGPESGEPRTSLKAMTDAAGVTVQSEQTTSTETQSGLTVGLNFTSSTLFVNSFSIPPDTMGGVGQNHIVELINGRYSVYRKSDGAHIQTSSLDQFWRDARVSFNGSTFDPRILYDPFAKRWFASSADNSFGDNHFLLAVSKSSDPTAGWTGFAIDSDSSNLRWADFPTLGFNKDGVYLSANMFPIPDRAAFDLRTTIVAIPKKDLLTATPTVAGANLFENNFIDDTGVALQPVVDFDNTGLPAALLSSPLETFFPPIFKRSKITGNITTPTLDTSDGLLSVNPFFGPFSANQPGVKQNLEILNGSIFHTNIVKVNGTLWGVQTVNNETRAALRWFQIDADTDTLLQEGLIADRELDFYYGSIAVNKFEDVVIGFNGSGELQFVSSYAVSGKTISGVTTFGQPLLLKAGVNNYEVLGDGRNRWGDYSATVIDPADPFSFWTFQEFVSSEDIWSTQITQLLLPSPEVVNRFVSLVPDRSTFRTTPNAFGCPAGFVGKFSFDATLTNQSNTAAFSHLLVKVTTLTNGNLLQNADFVPGAVGSTLTVPKAGNFSDGVLSTGEFVDVPFSICLKNTEPFTFFVNVLGLEASNNVSNILVLKQ